MLAVLMVAPTLALIGAALLALWRPRVEMPRLDCPHCLRRFSRPQALFWHSLAAHRYPEPAEPEVESRVEVQP